MTYLLDLDPSPSPSPKGEGREKSIAPHPNPQLSHTGSDILASLRSFALYPLREGKETTFTLKRL